jgi:hypothetical protein
MQRTLYKDQMLTGQEIKLLQTYERQKREKDRVSARVGVG